MCQPGDLVQEAGASPQQEGEAAAGEPGGGDGDEEGSGRHLQLEQDEGISSLLVANAKLLLKVIKRMNESC